MVLIIVGEFADNTPGDDIKLITHNSPVLEENALLQIIVPTYLGLFSSGGNSHTDKYGTIPLENNKTASAWSITTNNGLSRLLLAVVPSNEVSDIIEKINTPQVSERIQQIKTILSKDDLDLSGLNRTISLLNSALHIKDEVSRLSDVFGTEI